MLGKRSASDSSKYQGTWVDQSATFRTEPLEGWIGDIPRRKVSSDQHIGCVEAQPVIYCTLGEDKRRTSPQRTLHACQCGGLLDISNFRQAAASAPWLRCTPTSGSLPLSVVPYGHLECDEVGLPGQLLGIHECWL